MNFCRTFRNTALKEIGKIYTVQGRKSLLSFPAPYTCVFFCVLLSRGFSRLPQKESLLTVYIHSSYQVIFPGETRALVILWHFLTTWPLFMKLQTWILNVCPKQSAISSLSNLLATESMRMILTRIDCERTGNRWLLQSWQLASSVVP